MLPILEPLLPDESIDSWLETLAALNHCEPRHIVHQQSQSNGHAAAPLSISLQPATADALSKRTGVEPETLLHATLSRYRTVGLSRVSGQRQGEASWSFYPGTKYCPDCLAARGLRWKLEWHLSWINACPEHHRLLLHRCPACHAPPRSAGWPHPPRAADTTGNRRIHSCAAACATEELAAAPTPQLTPAALAETDARIRALLDDDTIHLPYTGNVTIGLRYFFTDLTFLTRRALDALRAGRIPDEALRAARLDPHLAHTLVDPNTAGSARIRKHEVPFPLKMLAATHLALWSLDTVEEHSRPEHGWLKPAEAKAIVSSLNRNRNSRHTRYLARLVGQAATRQPPSPQTDGMGRLRSRFAARALLNARPHAIDTSLLPATLWPTAVERAPTMPPRVARTFSQLAPIAIASIGRDPNYHRLALQFGLDEPNEILRRSLNHLVHNENGTATRDHLLSLRDHLATHGVPIDYRRRRRLFTTPTLLLSQRRLRSLARTGGKPRSAGFSWMMNRYVWQLLTGYAPMITQGAELLHGPAGYAYRRFVNTMPPQLQIAAGETAERLLRRHRIGEPVAIDLHYDTISSTWAAEPREIRYLPQLHRTDFRRSSLSLQLAASTAGDCEELLHLALSGEPHLALRLYRFVLTADLPNTRQAASALGLSPAQPTRELKKMEEALGDTLFIRHRGNSPDGNRTLTPIGKELRTLALPALADLERVAGPDATPPDLSLLEPPLVVRRKPQGL